MLDMLVLAESELFVGISISTYSWYLREIRCIEVISCDAHSMHCRGTRPHGSTSCKDVTASAACAGECEAFLANGLVCALSGGLFTQVPRDIIAEYTNDVRRARLLRPPA